MDKRPIHKSLLSLYNKVKAELRVAMQDELLTKIPYERINATTIDYDHETFQLDWKNIEYYDVYVWGTDNFHLFKEKMEVTSEYTSAVDEVCREFNIPKENRKYADKIGIFGFVRLLMNEVPNNRITDENIENYIETFLNDYNVYKTDRKFTWQIQIWLNSIYFEGEKISLSRDVTLRKPQVEELHIVRQRRHYIDDFSMMTGRGLPSTCILEFSMKAETQNVGHYHDDIKHEIENWVDALRLFKVGNINAVYKSIMPISVSEHGTTEKPESPFDKSWKDKIDYSETSNYKYPVKKEEAEQLFEFAQKIKPALNSISQKAYLSGSYLDLAFHRYKDSLLRSEVNVNRMISAITCLEALLSNSPAEITYKISIHVAGLLGHFGFDTVKVFEKMKTAYKIRSVLLHGSNLSGDLSEFANSHTHEIVNYARICLLVSLRLKNSFSKDNLIKKIDHSLINPKDHQELNGKIKEQVFIPIIYPFRNIPGGDEFEKKKIACIGWGSLIWQPKELKLKSEWFYDGPKIPVEFLRQSKDNRITLVIDKESKPVQTCWALMEAENIEDAVASLKKREGSDKISVLKATDTPSGQIKTDISNWLAIKGLDAVIWTGLGPKFKGEDVRPSLDDILAHLKALKGDEKVRAEEYVRKTPKQVQTTYRAKIEEELGWRFQG